MTVKRGLGMGLSDLLGAPELPSNVDSSSEKIEMIKISNIKPNPNQPRKYFNEEKLQELSESIKENGVIQPLIVQQDGSKYMIIAGERRYRASKLAGVSELPCIVKNYTDEELIKVSLLENIQREDLNSIEEAETYKSIIEEFNITQDKLADQLGKSRTYITNSLRLLNLSDHVKNLVIKGELMHSVARALITLDHKEQDKLADLIIKEGFNARQVEKYLSSKKDVTIKKSEPKVLPLEYSNIERSLKEFFGSKVKLSHNEKDKKGKIEINYFSDDDLERILNLLNINL
ncbi:MAG: ParB/RepB/Spo0J family partition protein [archaeon]|nr:ParB/RepB/Spo0J family partition protein [archaeon]